MREVPKDYVDHPTKKCEYCKEEHITQVMIQHIHYRDLFFCSHNCIERWDRENHDPRGWL